MQNSTFSRKHRTALKAVSGAVVTAAALLSTGCGVHLNDVSTTPVTASGVALHGNIHGGQQPVSGSTIQVYAASANGYGAASYALLSTATTSDASGNFSVTGAYTCPSASSMVYIVATGGNSGSGTNSALAMMTALGACGNLNASTFVTINEVTTVASVYALAPFMTGYASVGATSSNAQGLTNAFATVNKLANTATGSSTGTLPAGATGPSNKLNTLADILASCVNTSSASSSQCSTLFTNTTTAGGAAPTDTIAAALNIARNPGTNVSALLALVAPAAPFQPTMANASDFSLAIKYKPTASTPSASAVAANGDLWVTNAGNNTVSVLDGTTGAATVFTGGGLSGPSGIAFDQSGNAWVTNKVASSLSVFTAAGVGSAATAPLNAPTAIAINGANQLWVANGGNNTVTSATISGTSVTGTNTYGTAGVTTPTSIAINPY